MPKQFMTCTAYLLTLFAVTAQAVDKPLIEQGQSLAGEYTCGGISSDGSRYTMQLVVIPAGDTYELAWTISNGQPAANGLGLLRDGWLAVVFGNQRGVGVALYKVEPNELYGEWTGGNGKVERETCRKGIPA